jgi:lactoylglutathione lyase
MKKRFDLVGLFVTDLSKMVNFYRDVIGIHIEWNGEGPYAEFQHEGIRFAMYERRMLPQILGQTPEYTNKLNGTFELAINVGAPANVDKEYERIIKQGGKSVYGPRNEPWKMRSAMITDHDGNLIEIASDFWE